MTAASDTIQTDAGELLLANCGAMRVINLSSRRDRRQELQQQYSPPDCREITRTLSYSTRCAPPMPGRFLR